VLAERRHQRARDPGDRGQRDHEQVEAADSELVADAQLGDPLVVGHVLEPVAGLEVDQQHDGVEQHRDRPRQHRPARQLARQERT
jgi:hypothetical protein